MGTSSCIAVKMCNKYRAVYCNMDGYIEWNGRILFENYNTHEKVEKLVSLGDISSLNPSTECPDGHTYDTPVKGYSVFYNRDRGEDWDDVKYEDFDSYNELVDFYSTGFNYVFSDGVWTVNGSNLGNELSKLKEVE